MGGCPLIRVCSLIKSNTVRTNLKRDSNNSHWELSMIATSWNDKFKLILYIYICLVHVCYVQ